VAKRCRFIVEENDRVLKLAAALRSVRQIPPSSVSGQLAGQISVNAMEQTKQVQEITGLLKTWHGELEQRRRQCVSHHV
jgi:hypothetical protein